MDKTLDHVVIIIFQQEEMWLRQVKIWKTFL